MANTFEPTNPDAILDQFGNPVGLRSSMEDAWREAYERARARIKHPSYSYEWNAKDESGNPMLSNVHNANSPDRVNREEFSTVAEMYRDKNPRMQPTEMDESLMRAREEAAKAASEHAANDKRRLELSSKGQDAVQKRFDTSQANSGSRFDTTQQNAVNQQEYHRKTGLSDAYKAELKAAEANGDADRAREVQNQLYQLWGGDNIPIPLNTAPAPPFDPTPFAAGAKMNPNWFQPPADEPVAQASATNAPPQMPVTNAVPQAAPALVDQLKDNEAKANELIAKAIRKSRLPGVNDEQRRKLGAELDRLVGELGFQLKTNPIYSEAK